MEKYTQSGSLYITYWENGAFAGEPAEVTIAGDEYAEFTLTHNSTFVITSAKPVFEPGGERPEAGEKPEEGNKAGSNENAPAQENPQTGDESGLLAYLLLALLAAAGIPTLLLVKRRVCLR